MGLGETEKRRCCRSRTPAHPKKDLWLNLTIKKLLGSQESQALEESQNLVNPESPKTSSPVSTFEPDAPKPKLWKPCHAEFLKRPCPQIKGTRTQTRQNPLNTRLRLRGGLKDSQGSMLRSGASSTFSAAERAAKRSDTAAPARSGSLGLGPVRAQRFKDSRETV